MKFTTYEQFKNATEAELSSIDIDDYNDEETKQLSIWFMRAKQDCAFENTNELCDLTNEEITWLGLNNKQLLNTIISENVSDFNISGNAIKAAIIIEYPEYYIIKEDEKNNFYRIMK